MFNVSTPPPPPPPILKSNLDLGLEKWNVYGVDVDSPVDVGFGRNGRILWPPRSTLEGVWNVGGGGYPQTLEGIVIVAQQGSSPSIRLVPSPLHPLPCH